MKVRTIPWEITEAAVVAAFDFFKNRSTDLTQLASVTPAQQLMIEEGLPNTAILDPAERAATWKGRKLTKPAPLMKAPPKDEDPATKKLRKELAAADEAKKAARFARLKELQQAKKKAAQPTETAMTTTATEGPKAAQIRALREKKAGKPAAPKKAAAKKAAPKAAKKATAKPKAEGGVRPGSKLEAIVKLLTREKGCTTADVLKATEWPAVSMPQQAKAAGLKLRKEKVPGEPTRYYGTA